MSEHAERDEGSASVSRQRTMTTNSKRSREEAGVPLCAFFGICVLAHINNAELWKRLSGKVSNEHLSEFKRFVAIKAQADDFRNLQLSPSPIVDQVWHHALQYPIDYIDMCHLAWDILQKKKQNGVPAPKVMDHNPDGSIDQSAQAVRYERTLNAYKEMFCVDPPESIWPRSTCTCPSIQLYVKTLTGHTVVCLVVRAQTVLALKEMLLTKTDVPIDRQRLVFAGIQLADDKTLDHYNLGNDAKIHMVERLRGC